jgi:V/A-type H+-transporting ATPase subunit E
MPVEAIIEKIISDGMKEIEAIHAAAEQEAGKLRLEGQQAIRAIVNEAEQEAERLGQAAVRKNLSKRQMDIQKDLLNVKQQAIDSVFDQARKRVADLGDHEYRKVMLDLVLAFSETGEEELIIGTRDVKRLTPVFIKAVNAVLKKKKRAGKIRLGRPSADVDGGFILRQGRKEIDATLAGLFRSARHDLESETADILFGKSR